MNLQSGSALKSGVIFPGIGHTYTLAEVRKSGGESPSFNSIMSWIDGFLACPHNELGRSGNVCPFVAEASLRGALELAEVCLPRELKHVAREYEKLLMFFRDRFLEGDGSDPATNNYRSLIVVFPDVSTEEAPSLMGVTQKTLKPDFVQQGLMLGEFYPRNNAPGLRNPEFRPLQSPIPLLVVRHMVESDIDFLNRQEDSPSSRFQFLTSYLNFLGRSLSPALRLKATAALRTAEDELSSDTA